MVADCDRATCAVARSDRPVLVEGSCALDGGLVDTLSAIDVVGRAVRGESA